MNCHNELVCFPRFVRTVHTYNENKICHLILRFLFYFSTLDRAIGNPR
jgi:hypothetical protein